MVETTEVAKQPEQDRADGSIAVHVDAIPARFEQNHAEPASQAPQMYPMPMEARWTDEDLDKLLDSDAPVEALLEAWQPAEDRGGEPLDTGAALSRLRELRERLESAHAAAPQIAEKFEQEHEGDVLVVGSITLEEAAETQLALERQRLAAAEREAALYTQRQAAVARQEQIARRRLTEERRAREQLLGAQREILDREDKSRRFALRRELAKVEDKLKKALERRKGEVTQTYGQLEALKDGYQGLVKRNYRVEWAHSPLPVQVRLEALRGIRDKLPLGKYVLLVSLYERLGGNPLRWGNLQSWGASLPMEHSGHYSVHTWNVQQDVFVVCPALGDLKPSMAFMFELFRLSTKEDACRTDEVVAWGCFPAVGPDLTVISGKFKVPLLRGPTDAGIDSHEILERTYASNLDDWMGNLYFQAFHLPRYSKGVKEYEVELKITSELLRYPNRELLGAALADAPPRKRGWGHGGGGKGLLAIGLGTNNKDHGGDGGVPADSTEGGPGEAKPNSGDGNGTAGHGNGIAHANGNGSMGANGNGSISANGGANDSKGDRFYGSRGHGGGMNGSRGLGMNGGTTTVGSGGGAGKRAPPNLWDTVKGQVTLGSERPPTASEWDRSNLSTPRTSEYGDGDKYSHGGGLATDRSHYLPGTDRSHYMAPTHQSHYALPPPDQGDASEAGDGLERVATEGGRRRSFRSPSGWVTARLSTSGGSNAGSGKGAGESGAEPRGKGGGGKGGEGGDGKHKGQDEGWRAALTAGRDDGRISSQGEKEREGIVMGPVVGGRVPSNVLRGANGEASSKGADSAAAAVTDGQPQHAPRAHSLEEFSFGGPGGGAGAQAMRAQIAAARSSALGQGQHQSHGSGAGAGLHLDLEKGGLGSRGAGIGTGEAGEEGPLGSSSSRVFGTQWDLEGGVGGGKAGGGGEGGGGGGRGSLSSRAAAETTQGFADGRIVANPRVSIGSSGGGGPGGVPALTLPALVGEYGEGDSGAWHVQEDNVPVWPPFLPTLAETAAAAGAGGAYHRSPSRAPSFSAYSTRSGGSGRHSVSSLGDGGSSIGSMRLPVDGRLGSGGPGGDEGDGERDWRSYMFALRTELAPSDKHERRGALVFVWRELVWELGLRGWRTVEFWVFIAMFIATMWLRIYLHYLGQWAYLYFSDVVYEKFDIDWHTIHIPFKTDQVGTSVEVAIVASGTVTLLMIVFVLMGISFGANKYASHLPEALSRLVMCLCVCAILDPVAILVVDLISKNTHYSPENSEIGDAFKLPDLFSRREGNGIVGIFITLMIYLSTACCGVIFLYNYVLRVHMGGRALDLYHRIHGRPSNFFVPEDNELSAVELRFICDAANRWRSPAGGRRIVKVVDYELVDPEVEGWKEVTSHVIIRQLEPRRPPVLHRHFVRLPDGTMLELMEGESCLGALESRGYLVTPNKDVALQVS